MPSSRSTRRRSDGVPRNSAEDATVVTADPRSDQPAYEPVDGDVDTHRHFGGSPHAHTDPPHWHDGDQTFPLHDYPADDDAALYGTDPNPDNGPLPYERPRLGGPYQIDLSEGARSDVTVPPEQVGPPSSDAPEADRLHPLAGREDRADDPGYTVVDPLPPAPEADPDDTAGDGAELSKDEEQRFVDQVRKLSPESRATTKASLQRVIGSIDSGAPARPPAPLGPPPVPVAGRLGADLGGLEVVKATYRAMFPGAPDAVAEEWALTMGASDVIGRMLGYHRQGRFADPSLVADLCAMVRQVEAGTTTREPSP